MLKQFITNNPTIHFSIKETFDTVLMKTTEKDFIKNKSDTFIIDFMNLLNNVSSRDKFELKLILNGNSESVTSSHDDPLTIINNHISEFTDEEELTFELELTIDKLLTDNQFSIYFLDSFLDFLTRKPVSDLIAIFSKYINQNINFEIFDNFEQCYSDTISFYSFQEKEKKPSKGNTTRKIKFDLFNSHSNNSVLTSPILPSDFYLLKRSKNNTINNLFDKLSSLLSIIYISNECSLENNSISFKINGYKTITQKNVDLASYADKNEILQKVFCWTYDEANSVDKIGLVRNIISIHLDSDGEILLDDALVDAIHSNYQIYLQENIQSYLDVKNKIGEFIFEYSSKTYQLSDELINSFKNNIFIIISFLVGVVLVNGLKDNGIQTIFSTEYVFITIFISVLSVLWLLLINNDLQKRFDKSTENIKNVLTINYKRVIEETEIHNTINPIIENNKQYLETQQKFYNQWWLSILSIFIILFTSAHYIFYKPVVLVTDKASLIQQEKTHLKILQNINTNITQQIITENNKLNQKNKVYLKERASYQNKISELIQQNKQLQESIKNIKKSQ